MTRLQGALRKTLEEDHERVHLQVKDKEVKLKTSGKREGGHRCAPLRSTAKPC